MLRRPATELELGRWSISWLLLLAASLGWLLQLFLLLGCAWLRGFFLCSYGVFCPTLRLFYSVHPAALIKRQVHGVNTCSTPLGTPPLAHAHCPRRALALYFPASLPTRPSFTAPEPCPTPLKLNSLGGKELNREGADSEGVSRK